MEKKEKVFLLWGQDAEMQHIKSILDKEQVPYIDKWLGRWAKVEDYAEEIKQLIAEWKQPVAIELTGAGEGEYANVMSIDHHGKRALEKASILQILDLLGLTPSRDEEMIAAIDAWWPKAMLRAGFTKEDVIGESKKIFDSQNISEEMVAEAKSARDNREVIWDTTIVKMSHSKCATIHRLNPGEYNGLVIISRDGEVNVFDNKELVQKINEKFPWGWIGWDWLLVDSIQTCYWGWNPNLEELEVFVREYANSKKE